MLSGPWTQILIDCTGTLTLANDPSTFAFHTLGRMRAPHWEWMISQGARIEGPSLHVRLRLTLNDDCPDIQNASTTSACFGCFGFGFGFEFGFVFIYVSESHGKHSDDFSVAAGQLQLIAPTVARRLSVVKCLPPDYYGFLRQSAAPLLPLCCGFGSGCFSSNQLGARVVSFQQVFGVNSPQERSLCGATRKAARFGKEPLARRSDGGIPAL